MRWLGPRAGAQPVFVEAQYGGRSIFPSVPRANTNLTAIMAGELMVGRLG
jgi:hypothetical protein